MPNTNSATAEIGPGLYKVFIQMLKPSLSRRNSIKLLTSQYFPFIWTCGFTPLNRTSINLLVQLPSLPAHRSLLHLCNFYTDWWCANKTGAVPPWASWVKGAYFSLHWHVWPCLILHLRRLASITVELPCTAGLSCHPSILIKPRQERKGAREKRSQGCNYVSLLKLVPVPERLSW